MTTVQTRVRRRRSAWASSEEADADTQREAPHGHDTPGGSTSAGRVVIVAPQPFYADRGTPIAVRQVSDALVQLGYEVDLLTFPVGRSVQLPGVRLFRSSNPFRIRSVPIGFSLRKLALDGSLVPALRRRLRRDDYICVHAVEEAGFPAVLLGREAGVPVIYDMHSSLPERMTEHRFFGARVSQRVLRRCERWLLSNADLVISSTGLASGVRALAPRARVEEWSFVGEPRPVDPEDVERLRRRLGLPPDARVVLYTGNFEPYQGVSLLLGAIPRVREVVEDVVFVLVGAEASGRGPAGEDVAALEAAGALRLMKRQPRERMPAFLSLADVLVSPRLHGANLPLKIFDYLAAGRPIVATDNSTHRTILDDRLAVLVPPAASEIARAVAGLLRDRERAEMLGEAGLRYAREHLSWARFVDSVDTIYGRVTA